MTGNPKYKRVLVYCGDYLNQETLHVYRQLVNFKDFKPYVVARRIKNLDIFPLKKLDKLERDPNRIRRYLHKFYCKRIKKQSYVEISEYEKNQFLRKAADINADLIHVYFGTEAARILPYLADEKRPIIISFHGADTSDALNNDDFDRILSSSQLLLARSESLKQQLIKRGCSEDRILLNPAGVPIPLSFKSKNYDNDQNRLSFLQACRFIEKKGLDISIRCISELKKMGYNVHLDLVGNGPCEQALKNLVDQLDLKEEVSFFDFVENSTLLKMMGNYHFFLHPSVTTKKNDREGIPNSLMEAMVSGCVVVTTNHSGIPELITHLSDGIMLSEADPKIMASAIADIINSPEIADKLVKNARKKITDTHSIDVCIEHLEAAYQHVLQNNMTTIASSLD